MRRKRSMPSQTQGWLIGTPRVINSSSTPDLVRRIENIERELVLLRSAISPPAPSDTDPTLMARYW